MLKGVKEISDSDIVEQYRLFFKNNHYVLIKNILTSECIDYFMNNITLNINYYSFINFI